MLVAGDMAPDFTATAQDGTTFHLAALRSTPIVLYFYPRAGSAGCTRESIEFARFHPEFVTKGVRIIGISVDPPDRQREFAEDCRLPFPLLSDPSREIARAFGALGVLGLAKRVTFLIDASGRIAEVIDSFLPGAHVERARKGWPAASGGPPP